MELKELFTELKEMLVKINTYGSSINKIKIQILNNKARIEEIEKNIEYRKAIISHSILNDAQYKNESQRSNAITLACMSDADMQKLEAEKSDLKKKNNDLYTEQLKLECELAYLEELYKLGVLEIKISEGYYNEKNN